MTVRGKKQKQETVSIIKKMENLGYIHIDTKPRFNYFKKDGKEYRIDRYDKNHIIQEINEATFVASARVKSWAIVLEWERPDGTLYTETKADVPSHVSDEIDEYITKLEEKIN